MALRTSRVVLVFILGVMMQSGSLAVGHILLQPFYGGNAPLPAQDRQFSLGVTWHL